MVGVNGITRTKTRRRVQIQRYECVKVFEMYTGRTDACFLRNIKSKINKSANPGKTTICDNLRPCVKTTQRVRILPRPILIHVHYSVTLSRPSPPVIANFQAVHNSDPLSQTSPFLFLPPALSPTFAQTVFIFRIYQPSVAPFVTDNDDGLPHPAGELSSYVSFIST
jgi:hypothetical protein